MVKVSVIMPAYNAAKTIEAAIKSVIDQVFTDWELVIVNDASRDATSEIASGFVQLNKKIKLVNLERNKGLSNARNVGVANATGEFIAFLDSDDLWHPNKLLDQVSYHNKHQDCLISHTGFQAFNEYKTLNRPWKIIFELITPKSGDLLPHLYYKNNIGVLTVMLKRAIFEEIGGFDTKLVTFEDNDLWIRIAEKGYKFGFIGKKLAYYRVSSNSLSNSPVKYKKAYKAFIRKYSITSTGHSLKNRIWGNYYRHFGTHYFKSKQYVLANLYFTKSLHLHKLSFISLTTLLYLLISRWMCRR